MPYQQNIPQPTDQLDDSQGDILGNFQEIYNLVGVNHVQFGGAAGQGKHTIVTLPENAAPTPTLIDEASIFSRLSVFTNQTELAWQRENAGDIIEWTGSNAAQQGWTRLPSGILLKWGFVATNAAPTVVVFPVAATIPPFNPFTPNNPFCVLVTPTLSGGGSSIYASLTPGTVTSTQFSVETFNPNAGGGGNLTATNIYYLAIGI